jgi:hypothetical protein
MTRSTSTYAAWQRLSSRPGGSRLFSVAAMARVPYFASVLPHVLRMEPGLAEVPGSEVVLRLTCPTFTTSASFGKQSIPNPLNLPVTTSARG